LQLIGTDGSPTGWSASAYDFKALVQMFDSSQTADRSAWAMSAHLLDTHLTMNDGSAWGGELAVRHATHGDSPDLFGIARDELVHPSFGAQAQVVGTRFGSSPIGIAA